MTMLENSLREWQDETSSTRVDRDEQLFGTIAEEGVIGDILDAEKGIVRAILISNSVVVGRIYQFTAPVLSIGSRVVVINTRHTLAYILPKYQYPPSFRATAIRVTRNETPGALPGRTTKAPIATVDLRHTLPNMEDSGELTATTTYELDVQQNDLVKVDTQPTLRVALQGQGYSPFIVSAILRRP